VRAALDAHQLETGHELDQPDHPLHHPATQEPAMINGRVYGYLDDNATQKIGGTITAVGGRYSDIKAIQWDDGTTSNVGEHERGWSWDYEDED
jgi:hypothetical protein